METERSKEAAPLLSGKVAPPSLMNGKGAALRFGAFLVLLILVIVVTAVIVAKKGERCKKDLDCPANRTCVNGYCK